MYTHESLNNDTGAITNEQLKTLIEDHTGKNLVQKIVIKLNWLLCCDG